MDSSITPGAMMCNGSLIYFPCTTSAAGCLITIDEEEVRLLLYPDRIHCLPIVIVTHSFRLLKMLIVN